MAKKDKDIFDSLFQVKVISGVGLKQNFLCIEEVSSIALKYMSYQAYIWNKILFVLKNYLV